MAQIEPHSTLQSLWARGTELLGCRYAIMGGAMSWVSERNLVSATSNAGGFGVLACGAMPPELLQKEIQATRELTDKPFGVNLILMHPELDKLVEICVQERVSHVVLAGGIPRKDTIVALQEGGCKVIGFAPALPIARRLVKHGIDGLVIEGSEAGGHIGPVSLSVLAQEILPNITEVPVFVAGGIGRGEAMVSMLRMGAAGCQVGTMLVCAEESIAHENMKKMFIKSSARDATVSSQLYDDFPVIPVRALENKATRDFADHQHQVAMKVREGKMAKDEGALDIEHFWAGALRRAVIDGDVDSGSVMAGQSVGLVSKVAPVSEILNEFVAQANDFVAA